MTTEEVIEELEALTAILDEGTVEIVNDESDRPREISIKITPLTASEQEKQYVSLTLVITLPIAYPNAPPTLGIRNPRGLEDSAIGGLLDEMNTRCDEYVGCPVLFELIEMSREFLTSRNVPVVRCIICLSNIKEEDQFMKTECLHFFHKHCLGRYITNMQETHAEQIAEAQGQNSNNSVKDFKVTCPVCRETIGESRYNLADLLQSTPPISEQEEPKSYTISDDVRKMQRMMQKLYTQQKEKGGIIDLEAEEKKFLVVTNTGNEDEEKFTELSPTDYQLDDQGFHCAKVSPPKSPEKMSDPSQSTEEEQYCDSHYYKGYEQYGRTRGRGKSRGYHKHSQSSSENPDERASRNAYRKNHYLNRGKSYHQQKKGKPGAL